MFRIVDLVEPAICVPARLQTTCYGVEVSGYPAFFYAAPFLLISPLFMHRYVCVWSGPKDCVGAILFLVYVHVRAGNLLKLRLIVDQVTRPTGGLAAIATEIHLTTIAADQ